MNGVPRSTFLISAGIASVTGCASTKIRSTSFENKISGNTEKVKLK